MVAVNFSSPLPVITWMTVLPEAPSDSALAACGHPWQQLSSFYQPWAHTCVLDFAPKWIMEKRCLCFQEELSYPNWSPNPAVFQLQVWGVWKLLTLKVTSHRSWTEACQLTILMERAFCKVSFQPVVRTMASVSTLCIFLLDLWRQKISTHKNTAPQRAPHTNSLLHLVPAHLGLCLVPAEVPEKSQNLRRSPVRGGECDVE